MNHSISKSTTLNKCTTNLILNFTKLTFAPLRFSSIFFFFDIQNFFRRRRLAIDGSGAAPHADGSRSAHPSNFASGQPYHAEGMVPAEAKKSALASCILVYVPPKRTAAEAKAGKYIISKSEERDSERERAIAYYGKHL